MIPNIPFNSWSWERLHQGRKWCTSRTKMYNVEGVINITPMKLSEVKEKHWRDEGADSPEEFEKVWCSIHPSGFKPNLTVYVHWFNNQYGEVKE